MASSPEDSPTPSSSPPPSPDVSPPPPPSKSSPPPPPPPSSSPPAPAESEESPPPPPPPSSSSPSPSSSPPPAPGKANNGTPSPPPPPLSHSPTTPAPKVTPKNGTPTLASPPPPPSSPNSDGSDSLPTLPIVVGVTVGVALLFTIIIALVVAIVWNRKKKSKYDNQIQYYTTPSTSPNGGGYGMSPIEEQNKMKNGYRANNDHLVINLPPPPGGNGGRGGWPQAMLSPQGQRPPVEMSPTYSVQNSSPSIPPSYPSPMGLSQGTFSYEELAIATHGFSQANVLGQGGFGFVHKGILPNSKEIAVKSLKSGSGQGAREFQAEVEIISRVHHRHLVSLVGYCIEGDQKMLVYEFVPNKTLEFHLHSKQYVAMDWPTRLKIALGAAKGLAYLHEDCSPRIIHRDIKSANILLDFNFEAQVADFGLAKLTQDNNTHVSTRVMGTFGYLAPEYASSGKLTEKSDVYSFGVVLLELITGRRPLDLNSDMDESLVDWARPLCTSATEDGDFTRLVDPRLENNYDHEEMARIVACAGACIRHSARRRPKMRQIVRALEDDVPLDDLKDAVKAVKSSRSMNYSYDYDADMARFRKLALESHGDGTSEFGNTSEYGLNPSSSSSDESGSYEIPSRRKP
ncbi:hypothetical protein CCACVL1_16856 [Corchorus capsularis]|uniref:non-specific serine/threonine protein kinase n=1 Tax=Corchorus capsularis TaxID=210143 RepID=A0A1R3HVG6_COCAP|nr:hypothetical protein CCACVL1_16856 [Corchorus capsularis]